MKSKIQNLKSKIHVGCQGWNYDDWTTKAGGAGVFYPRGTRSGKMLAFYSQIFDTIEVDSTFYAIPSASSVEGWYKKTPAGFTFSLKMPQEITHEHALRESSFEILDEFCERITNLREKLGVVLVQLAPQFEASKENAQNLRKFLERLPKEIRFAIEFRDMKERRKVLYGPDVIAHLKIEGHYYRAQVEHELRSKLLRLRQQGAAQLSNPEALLKLCLDSVSTFFA